jgi:hypothetical protein
MANITSKSQARRKVREAQACANEARARRECQNVEDTATLLVARGRLATIDEWEAERIAQVRAEGQRRRQEHRVDAGAAITRLQARGESLQTIAVLAEIPVARARSEHAHAVVPGRSFIGNHIVLETVGLNVPGVYAYFGTPRAASPCGIALNSELMDTRWRHSGRYRLFIHGYLAVRVVAAMTRTVRTVRDD